MEKWKYYIAERGNTLMDIKIVGRCKNKTDAVLNRAIMKSQEPTIDFFILCEVEI